MKNLIRLIIVALIPLSIYALVRRTRDDVDAIWQKIETWGGF